MLLRLGNFTLVAAEPRTGRTHQIRAHFAATGHPLVGDTLYGAPERARAARVLLPALERVFLHAARLRFAHPRSGEPVDVRAPLDRGLRAYLAELGDWVADRAAQQLTRLCAATYNSANAHPGHSCRLLGDCPVWSRGFGRSSRSSPPLLQEPPATQTPPLRQNVNLVDVLFTVFDKRTSSFPI